MQAKLCTPLPPPDSLYKKNPQPPLTEKERGMYDQVHRHFAAPGYKLPGVENAQLTEDEKFWLSYECILRFLRASKWKTPATVLRLEATLKWRRDFGLGSLVTADHVEPEAVTGKEILFGHDTKGRPAFYMIPSRQNTDEAERQIQYAVWMLERCIDLMPPGVETLDILINFADRAKNPSIGTARAVLNILQDHYPERLGLSLIINVPFLVNAFFKLILPFVDPITREKIKFNPQVLKDGIFNADSLMAEWWGGSRDFEYVHEKYWPELVRLAKERESAWKEKWKEFGGVIGIREWDYKKIRKEGEGGDEGTEHEGSSETERAAENGGFDTDGDVAYDQVSCKETRDKGGQNGISVDTHYPVQPATATPTRTHSPWIVVDDIGPSGNDYGGAGDSGTNSNGFGDSGGGGDCGGGGDSGGGGWSGD